MISPLGHRHSFDLHSDPVDLLAYWNGVSVKEKIEPVCVEGSGSGHRQSAPASTTNAPEYALRVTLSAPGGMPWQGGRNDHH